MINLETFSFKLRYYRYTKTKFLQPKITKKKVLSVNELFVGLLHSFNILPFFHHLTQLKSNFSPQKFIVRYVT